MSKSYKIFSSSSPNIESAAMFRVGRSRACVNLRRPERLSRAHEIKSVCTPVLLTRLVCAYGREKKCGVLNVFSFPKYSFERETSYYRATKKKKTSEPMFSGCMVYTDTYFQSPCQTELSCMSLPVDLSRQSWLRFLVKNAFLLS